MFNNEFYDYYSFARENKYVVNGDVMNQLLIVIMGLIEERPEINEKFLVPLVEEMQKCKEYDDGISLDELLEGCGITLEKE
tara:strand:- start:316 stop:558 length:243 start_codon:yes stop_codon:yes gene_type:complete